MPAGPPAGIYQPAATHPAGSSDGRRDGAAGRHRRDRHTTAAPVPGAVLPRDLTLLVSGIFMGRQGLARELRGQPADQTLMAALIRLQDVATSLYDNQPL